MLKRHFSVSCEKMTSPFDPETTISNGFMLNPGLSELEDARKRLAGLK
jgi:hypothetical protein